MAQKNGHSTGGGDTGPKGAAGSQLHLVVGEDEYLVSEAAKALVEQLCPEEERTLGLEIVDGLAPNAAEALDALGRCLEAIRTVGFFGGRKVVWLREANYFADTKVGRVQDVKDAVRELTAEIKRGLSAEQFLVITAHKVDGRSAFLKACKAAGRVHAFERSSKGEALERQMADWTGQRCKERGLRMSRDAMRIFLQKTGVERRQILQELDKLDTYLGGEKDVRSEDIEDIVSTSREGIAWDLADAVGDRDLPRALRVVRQLLYQKESAIRLVLGVQSRFRELLLYKTAEARGWLQVQGSDHRPDVSWQKSAETNQAMEALGRDPRRVHPYRAAILLKQARRFTPRQLAAGHATAIAAHEQLVSSGISDELVLELMLIKMLGGSGSAKNSNKQAARSV